MSGAFSEPMATLTPDNIINDAYRRTGPHGFLDGSDQWLMWEAIWNLARHIKKLTDRLEVIDGDP